MTVMGTTFRKGSKINFSISEQSSSKRYQFHHGKHVKTALWLILTADYVMSACYNVPKKSYEP